MLCGAAVMIIAGSLGYRTLADLSLILGLCAGPSIGYLLHAGYQRAHDEDNGSHQQDKEAMEDQCRQSDGGDKQAKEDKRRQSDVETNKRKRINADSQTVEINRQRYIRTEWSEDEQR